MKINEAAIRKLAKLLEETGLGEIEVVEGEQAIRVSTGGSGSSHRPHAAPVAMASDPTVPQAANTQAPAAIAQEHPGAIVSPMVGTVYLSPEPGAPPFVRKGETVKAGDTLLIIEAMKVMNPIKADKGGTVTHVLVENGKPIEFGEVLMVIE
ncbi:MAG TPA: acetyl-CoA carboxylase biotin carboxyl carrier protein [Patescibacteria group bacterium]|nr:acetyl-CoA carboxylase biotin carboxyl carrier protein [Patescibacteria group bacterium]